MNAIKIGLIGCGKQAPKHISGLRKIPGVEIVLADIKLDLALNLAEKERLEVKNSPDDIFSDPTITAVDICTPTPSHSTLINAAIVAGKDFFCEKPLCDNGQTAKQILSTAEKHKRIGMVGYIYRFAPVFEKAVEILNAADKTCRSEVLGDIVTSYFRIGGRGSHQLWKHQKETSGGAINEMLVHMLDLALWFFGPVGNIEVLAHELLRPKRIIQGKEAHVDAEDYILLKLSMINGVTVICQADLLTPAFTQFVEIQGSMGTFMGSIQPDMPSFIYSENGGNGFEKGKTNLQFGPTNLFDKQMAEFVMAVKNHQTPSRCTIHDSVLLLETLDLIKERIIEQ